MACCIGINHTITLSDDGVVHSFGSNEFGQLGLGHNNRISLPIPIPSLPKIKQISCGGNFTVCVDYEGFIWSFGKNGYGQLGKNSSSNLNAGINFNVPQRILNIPPVLSVSCGHEHTLIITNDSDLWSCGNNNSGQLCLKEIFPSTTFCQKTSFSNISKISSGLIHSLFQNDKGEIFSCGHNRAGQCGLGHFNHPQITPTLIPNLPPNIVQFVCGGWHNLFLDSNGNVFSVGDNSNGQLGLGHNDNHNILHQIPNIPPIQSISCAYNSSYLIDIEGNLWTFGGDASGQLGHGDSIDRNVPTKIESLKDIQQISYGRGTHFLAKDSQNEIFVAGYNGYWQLGLELDISIPKEINLEYFGIWGEVFKSKAKSARK